MPPASRTRFGGSAPAPAPHRHAPGLGLYVDAGHARHGLDRIEAVPQLQLDGAALFHAPGDCRISIQYSTWRSALDPDIADGRAAQALVRWQFQRRRRTP